MKKFFLFIFLCLGSICAKAEKSDLVVSYDQVSPTFTGKLLHHQMLLLSNQEQAKFFNQETERVDSLLSSPKGEALYKEMVKAAYEKGDMRAVPMRKKTVYLCRSKKDNTVKEYDDFADEYWTYEEPFEAQEWEIIPDSTKTILGYECIKAVCDYRGRHWTAWFAPEIPVSDGPWKLCGLPGLILGAEEAEGKYSFLADGIKQEAREINPIFGIEKYQKTERKKYLQRKRKYSKNPLGYGGIEVGGPPPQINYDKTFDFLETDYRK